MILKIGKLKLIIKDEKGLTGSHLGFVIINDAHLI